MIFAAPSETLAGWHGDLDAALALPIKHMSTYSLTYEKGTAFLSSHKQDRRYGDVYTCTVQAGLQGMDAHYI